MRKIIKKITSIFFIFIILFGVTGCENKVENIKDSDAPANLKEATGIVEKAKLDADGNILISKENITREVRYYSYEYEGVIISLLAVRDSKDHVIVVLNTCQSCGGSPYAYFVQIDDETIQCQNCGNLFKIDELTELKENGCNPIGIENIEEIDNTIKIDHRELDEYKDLFENWKGPKK